MSLVARFFLLSLSLIYWLFAPFGQQGGDFIRRDDDISALEDSNSFDFLFKYYTRFLFNGLVINLKIPLYLLITLFILPYLYLQYLICCCNNITFCATSQTASFLEFLKLGSRSCAASSFNYLPCSINIIL